MKEVLTLSHSVPEAVISEDEEVCTILLIFTVKLGHVSSVSRSNRVNYRKMLTASVHKLICNNKK